MIKFDALYRYVSIENILNKKEPKVSIGGLSSVCHPYIEGATALSDGLNYEPLRLLLLLQYYYFGVVSSIVSLSVKKHSAYGLYLNYKSHDNDLIK